MKIRSQLCYTLAPIALCFPVHVQAASDANAAEASQSAPAGTASEEIIVTAQKQLQNAQDVPISIDVLSADRLHKLKLFNFDDLGSAVPGLSLTNATGTQQTATLRGIPFNPGTGVLPSVDIYLDEVALIPQVAFQGLYDVGQIEVLRGPQGSLRGRTSPAGAITITTRRPNLSNVEGYAEASASDDHLLNLQAAVNLPVITDRVAIRVAGLIDRNRRDAIYNINTGKHNSGRTESGRISLALQPSDNLHINLMYEHLENDNYLARQVIGVGSPLTGGRRITLKDRLSNSEGINRFRINSEIGILQADLDLGFANLSYIGGLMDHRIGQNLDMDSANAVPSYARNSNTLRHSIEFTQELRLHSKNNELWNYMFGIYYANGDSSVNVLSNSDTMIIGLSSPVYRVGVDVSIPYLRKSYALFTSHSFDFTDRLRLEAGMRYSILKSNIQSTINLVAPDPIFNGSNTSSINTVIPENVHHTNRPITGNASLIYKASRAVTAYLSYGRSFRAGVPAVGLTAPLGQNLLITEPEKSDSFEIGVKSVLAGGAIRLNFAAFYQSFKGYIGRVEDVFYRNPTTDRVDTTYGFNSNGDARVKGVEVQLHARPVDAFSFDLNASWARSRYRNARVPCNDFNQDGRPDSVGVPVVTPGQDVSYCLTNGRIAEEPDFTMSLGTELTQPIGDYQAFFRTLFSYRPGFTSEIVNVRYKAQKNLNLYMGITAPDKRWEITGWMKNVFNQQVISNSSDGAFVLGAQGGVFDSGYRIINSIRPREMGLTARVNF